VAPVAHHIVDHVDLHQDHPGTKGPIRKIIQDRCGDLDDMIRAPYCPRMTTSNETSESAARGSTGKQDLTPERLRELLASATLLPWWWVAVLTFVAVAAAMDTTLPESGGTRWHFAVGATSLIALALIWLPTAVRLISLVGGSVKAGGVEASAAGILQSQDKLIDDLANLRTSTERLGQEMPETAQKVRSIGAEVDKIAARHLPSEETLSDEVLDDLAREYERLRRDMPPGQPRTIRMDKLVNEVRIRAAASPASARRQAPALLRSSREGDRIVGLALTQGSPGTEFCDDLLRIFSNSASAFEQYHSLRALNEIALILGPEDRARAVSVLEREKSDPRDIGLMNDPYIPLWIDAVLSKLSGNLHRPTS
jgi:hypothetical protein